MKELLGYALLTLILCLAGCGDAREQTTSGKNAEQKSTRQSAVSAQIKNDAPIPTYTEVDRDRYDAPVKTQIELHGVVTGKLTELGLNKLLRQLYDKAIATRDFKYHGGEPTHVFIYLYTSREHFKSGMGQWIAMLSKTADDSLPLIQVKTESLSQMPEKRQKSRKVFRNPNAKRYSGQSSRLKTVQTMKRNACTRGRL